MLVSSSDESRFDAGAPQLAEPDLLLVDACAGRRRHDPEPSTRDRTSARAPHPRIDSGVVAGPHRGDQVVELDEDVLRVTALRDELDR